ncbi:MAG TPA: serine hydrolase [Flavisolibacter sp.]|jgi:CubicO group peptidase (beta-lactamase class C family)|nr:serine hydrolase [Flavisolibacter sp.]
MKNIFITALACLVLLSSSGQPSFVRDSLDNYVQKALADWQIPGAAVCIVKDGKVALIKGFGVAEEGTRKNIDAATLFGIGSNTKAFTGTLMALLDAEKTLSIDDNVQKWLPDFRLYDPWVSKEATLRDLLCHRLGFETFQGDFMYFDSDLNKQQVLQKLAQVKPQYSFRSRYGYTNAAFLAAGEAMAKATGKSWSQLLQERIFSPLGMSRTVSSDKDVASATNIATAHTVVNGVLQKIDYGKLDNIAPAGNIYSSAEDMSKWLLMLLANGQAKGKTVIPVRAIEQTRTPHTIIGNGGHPFNRAHFALYGLGWFLEEYSGRKVVSHTGGVNGFLTSVALVPEESLGILVFTNSDTNNFFEALRWEILDAYLGLAYRNYSGVQLQQYRASEKMQRDWLQKKRDTVAMNPGTTVPLSALAGRYQHPVYGWMQIAVKDGKATATFQHHKGRYATVEPLGGNRYLAQFNEAIYGNKVWPVTITNGKVRSVTVTVADFVEFTPYVFVKTN